MRRRLRTALALVLSAAPTGRRAGHAHGAAAPAPTEDRLSGARGTAPAPGRPEPGPGERPGSRNGGGPKTGRGPVRPAPEAGRRTGPVRGTPRERLRAWAELLRVSALFSVPGDALAGAAAVGRRPGRGTVLAAGASLCLYEAGMALNDWADRDEDAVDRPHRPIPSGRVSPAAALGAAGALTAAGLALAARAGRPALTVATGLAATVWAYDLRLKHTKAGPAAMAAARSLDLLLGATATATGASAGRTAGDGGRPDNVAGTGGTSATTAARTSGVLAPVLPALPAALVLGAHTYGVTAVSRYEAQGGSTGTPLAVLATTAALAAAVAGERRGRGLSGPAHTTPSAPGAPAHTTPGAPGPALTTPGAPGTRHVATGAFGAPAHAPGAGHAVPAPTRTTHTPPGERPVSAALARLPALVAGAAGDPGRLLTLGLTAAYVRTAAPPLLHAALNPSPPLTQRAVGGGIRAMIPLQAALAARAGAPVTGLAVMGLVPLARSLARKVSPT
ncbi:MULTISPECIES: SCO3242 family prenyltransferase [Streptomyces]|uniref:SCO3242 family prenyltransferase n=1 Tax=Streptomyces TaxID=1883 RepID=UPI0004BE1C5C|nr:MULTISPECIES: UbiA family prenyltransferase [Streptomyces]KOG79321.1 UbiA prenyltransferase [Streptomyces griseus subsp. rhodochrous]